MTTLPPDGIVPAEQRDRVTDRQPARPALNRAGDAGRSPEVSTDRRRSALASAVIVALGGLLGLVCSGAFVPYQKLSNGPTPAELVRACAINCVGVVLGALFFSWVISGP